MGIINKKSKLIFEFEETDKGTMVTTRVKGKLNLNDVLCAKQVIDNRLKELKSNGKNKRK